MLTFLMLGEGPLALMIVASINESFLLAAFAINSGQRQLLLEKGEATLTLGNFRSLLPPSICIYSVFNLRPLSISPLLCIKAGFYI